MAADLPSRTLHARHCIRANLWVCTELPVELITLIIDYVNPCKIYKHFGENYLTEHCWVFNPTGKHGWDPHSGRVLLGENFQGFNTSFSIQCARCDQTRTYPLPL